MSHAYTLERMNRTTSQLLLHFGDLRERLPEAYDEGISTIGRVEIAELASTDLLAEFDAITSRMQEKQPDGESWALASIAGLDDKDVSRLAARVVDFISRVEARIETINKETPHV